jgi:hypothetical protein
MTELGKAGAAKPEYNASKIVKKILTFILSKILLKFIIFWFSRSSFT